MRLLIAAAILLLFARPKVHTWNREKWISAALFGVSLGLMNGFFYAGIEVVPLGPAVTIEFVGPLLLAAVLSRSLRDATCVALALIGMALLGVDSLTGEPLNPRGALVLVSDPWLLFVALGTGVLSSLIPYSLEFIALKRLAPNVFSILIALEPVFAAFFGWLLLSPGVTALKLTAIALVVLASVVQTMVPARGRIIFRTIALRPRAPWRFRRPQN